MKGVMERVLPLIYSAQSMHHVITIDQYDPILLKITLQRVTRRSVPEWAKGGECRRE